MDTRARARSFLAGEALMVAEADALWQALKKSDLPLARAVLARLRQGLARPDILDPAPVTRPQRLEWCRQEALLTSKDPELGMASKHDRALEILRSEFDLDDSGAVLDAETLGITGGIYKRRYYDLGQLGDLKRAARCYDRAADGPVGSDAYTQINAAFLEDVIAETGDAPEVRRTRAAQLRTRVLNELSAMPDWWNAASRAEAFFGLGRYAEATAALAGVKRPAAWQLETTARQLAALAELRGVNPRTRADVQEFFDALFGAPLGGGGQPSAAIRGAAVQSAFLGKVGLALSGGGFRASFYHLG